MNATRPLRILHVMRAPVGGLLLLACGVIGVVAWEARDPGMPKRIEGMGSVRSFAAM